MSMNNKRFSSAVLICAEILLSALIIAARDLDAEIKINPTAPNVVQVEGVTSKPFGVNWFFLNTYANADGLGARIGDFYLFDENNRAVAVKKLIDGAYLADAKAFGFQYQINLAPLSNALTKAHVSWISGEQGILTLNDLLPQFSADNQPLTARIKFQVPAGWKIISTERTSGENIYDVENIAKAVFVIGKNRRETPTVNLNLVISGDWLTTDAETARMADEIYEDYAKLFGETPPVKPQIVLARLPKELKFGRWEAETRGGTTVIFSADKAFKAQSIQLLHEQLRHELFHLWIPNNLNLTGNYDWFYEGFTVYQALRTGLKMNQIRFEDFLATLAEAYNLDSFQTNKVSLIESSKNRWNGANPQVYARGMLVAFLCETALLRNGKNKQTLDNVFREVYQKHRFPNAAADGNVSVLSVLGEYKSLASIVEKYIKGAEKIDWETDLQAIGIESSAENSFVKLGVKAKLNGGQKDLLDKLGYNNWRKISRKTK